LPIHRAVNKLIFKSFAVSRQNSAHRAVLRKFCHFIASWGSFDRFQVYGKVKYAQNQQIHLTTVQIPAY